LSVKEAAAKYAFFAASDRLHVPCVIPNQHKITKLGIASLYEHLLGEFIA
jgi:hypothetical protein